MPPQLLLLFFSLLQCLPHTDSAVSVSSAVKATASVTVSAVATNVGAATALASVTVSFIVANKQSSCYLTAPTVPAFVTMQLDLSRAPRAVHIQAYCCSCYIYHSSTPLLLLHVVDWLGRYQSFVYLHT